MLLRRCTQVFIPVVAVLAGWLYARRDFYIELLFGPAPQLSALAGFDWGTRPNIAEEDLEAYWRDGYVVLRQVVNAEGIDILRSHAVEACRYQLLFFRFCYVKQGRWQVDALRDFLFHGPVGEIAHSFIKGAGVRVLQDGVFGVRKRPLNPFIFSYMPHIDHGGKPGIYGRLHSNTSGVSAWLPLQDIESKDGGSIILYRNFTQNECYFMFGASMTINNTFNLTALIPTCSLERLRNQTVKMNTRKGDLVLWNPYMLHQTEPVARPGHVRYAWHAWFADSDGQSCFQRDCWNRAEPCCAAALPPSGAKIHSPCYPQVYPTLLAHEVEAHFSNSPRPLIAWHGRRAAKLLEENQSCTERTRLLA